jgi:hypothetical protein
MRITVQEGDTLSGIAERFGKLGTGRYTGFLPDGRRHPHPIGEIWCATLMEMNRNIGAELGVQLVVDALKLSPTNPSFLEMRDSILAALDAMLTAGELAPMSTLRPRMVSGRPLPNSV